VGKTEIRLIQPALTAVRQEAATLGALARVFILRRMTRRLDRAAAVVKAQ
jgi:hypothetical protein